MKALLLGAREVAESCKMRECIEEMARAFSLAQQGRVETPLRTRLTVRPGSDILVMPSLVRGEKRSREKASVVQDEASLKVVSIFPDRVRGPAVSAVVLLLDGERGEVKAIMDGASLTAIRTGAVSGLSCRYLARKDSTTLGVVGAGVQAYQQVDGVASALGIERVKVYSRHGEHSRAFARRCASAFHVEARAASTVADCVRGSDVVVTATTSTSPVFDGGLVGEGTHVIAIGAYRPDARELDSALMSRASIFVDSREAAMEEAGDILIPLKAGVIREDAVKGELGELVAGAKGRRSVDEVTVFKSVGLAFEDNATGWLAYRRARALGLGKLIEL